MNKYHFLAKLRMLPKVLAFLGILSVGSVAEAQISFNLNIGGYPPPPPPPPGYGPPPPPPPAYGVVPIGPGISPELWNVNPIVAVGAAIAGLTPLYLYVPDYYRHHWGRYCGRYDACGRPVYFVKEGWYRKHHPHGGPGGPGPNFGPGPGRAPHWEGPHGRPPQGGPGWGGPGRPGGPSKAWKEPHGRDFRGPGGPQGGPGGMNFAKHGGPGGGPHGAPGGNNFAKHGGPSGGHGGPGGGPRKEGGHGGPGGGPRHH